MPLVATLACHTLVASTATDRRSLNSLQHSDQAIGLILDPEYRIFESHDRGISIADPQRYVIGPSLTALSVRYFQRGFERIQVSDRIDPGWNPGIGFVVRPHVDGFDNKLNASRSNRKMNAQDLSVDLSVDVSPTDPGSQTLSIELSAMVSTIDGRVVGIAQGAASRTHGDGFEKSKSSIEADLSQVAQQALAALVNDAIELVNRTAQTEN